MTQQQISQFPGPDTPVFAELCRRQDALTRGLSKGASIEGRQALFLDGVGSQYVPDPPTPVQRPRFTADGVAIVTPSITIHRNPPRPKSPWYVRLFQ